MKKTKITENLPKSIIEYYEKYENKKSNIKP